MKEDNSQEKLKGSEADDQSGICDVTSIPDTLTKDKSKAEQERILKIIDELGGDGKYFMSVGIDELKQKIKEKKNGNHK